MTSALDVVTFGEAMLLLADRPGPLEDAASFYKHTAGAETNVAIGLARLDRGARRTGGGRQRRPAHPRQLAQAGL